MLTTRRRRGDLVADRSVRVDEAQSPDFGDRDRNRNGESDFFFFLRLCSYGILNLRRASIHGFDSDEIDSDHLYCSFSDEISMLLS
ncbi:hypothetical protein OROGR_015626 [Orobanche gracilis]